jgi:ABC-type transporter Mla subunit MlaD
MKTTINRTFGLIVIIAAIAGLLFNIAGVVFVWKVKEDVTTSLVSTATSINTALGTTVQALDVAQTSLATSVESIQAMESTLNATAKTIETSSPMVDTLAGVMKEDLPETITSAQTSLASAQESARLIDSFLRALTKIPFVPDNLYDPPVPLDVALKSVSDSLQGLPKSFTTMGDSLNTTKGSLTTMQTDITQIASNVREINSSLENAQTVIDQYHLTVSDLQEQVNGTARIPLPTSPPGLTFVFTGWRCPRSPVQGMKCWATTHRGRSARDRVKAD